MDRNEFINYYRRTYGEDPDPELFEHYLGSNSYRPDPDYNPNLTLDNSGTSDLLMEIRNITEGIAQNVRNTLAQRKEERVTETEKPLLSEFSFMFLIFISKSCLYFLFKSSYEQGYDFSNI